MSTLAAKPFNQKIRITILRLSFLMLVPLVFFIKPYAYPIETISSEFLEIVGIVSIVACVLGRFWSILYVGGRKNQMVMQDGPYSMCRHPLYLFSTIGVFGFGLALASIVLAVSLGGATFIILTLTAKREEAFLRSEFGPAYDEYAARVPMIFPSLKNFRTTETVEFRVSTLWGNFFDALVFLAFIPMVELIEGIGTHYDLPFLALF
tara:strand:- start:35 stop:655 length:621 start_codon:yes stop_codon:yes gene_type:complete